MDNNVILENLKNIFMENGIIILDDEYNSTVEIDSIRFISIIVQVEDVFEIFVPDEYLSSTELSTFNDFLSLVEYCLSV